MLMNTIEATTTAKSSAAFAHGHVRAVLIDSFLMHRMGEASVQPNPRTRKPKRWMRTVSSELIKLRAHIQEASSHIHIKLQNELKIIFLILIWMWCDDSKTRKWKWTYKHTHTRMRINKWVSITATTNRIAIVITRTNNAYAVSAYMRWNIVWCTHLGRTV